MTSHLADTEFVDLLDGTLPAARVQHVDTCAACRQTADDLATAIARAEAVDVPEPSPLFWERFSNRVRAAIAAEPSPRRLPWAAFSLSPLQWSAVAAAAVLLLAVGIWRTTLLAPGTPASPIPPQIAAAPPVVGQTTGAPSDDPVADLDSDEAWAVVRTMADDVPFEEMGAAGEGPAPGSAEHLAIGLTDRERSELAQLIEEETRGRPTEPSS